MVQSCDAHMTGLGGPQVTPAVVVVHFRNLFVFVFSAFMYVFLAARSRHQSSDTFCYWRRACLKIPPVSGTRRVTEVPVSKPSAGISAAISSAARIAGAAVRPALRCQGMGTDARGCGHQPGEAGGVVSFQRG